MYPNKKKDIDALDQSHPLRLFIKKILPKRPKDLDAIVMDTDCAASRFNEMMIFEKTGGKGINQTFHFKDIVPYNHITTPQQVVKDYEREEIIKDNENRPDLMI